MERSGYMMNSKSPSFILSAVLFLLCLPIMVHSEDIISYDGSSQIYRAFIMDTANAFTKETGIKVVVKERKTNDAVPSLLAGTCNVGGIARKMTKEEKALGPNLIEVLICYDHIAVLVSKKNPVSSISMKQLRDVFSGKITEWKDLNGNANKIKVVIPSEKTASNENFRKSVMSGLSFSASATVTETAGAVLEKADENSITFISYGAVSDNAKFKELTIDNISPGSKGYPIAQEMYLVIKNDAPEYVKSIIVYFTKGNGRKFLGTVKLVSPYGTL
jgi:phosphate transport system substrate-binding protein